jgi:hypothetical protein
MPLMKIKSVWFGDGKTGNVTFEADPEKKIKVWANAPFRDALVVGAEAEAKFETIPAKGDFPEQKFLKSWGGVSMPEKPKGGGGGAPRKSPEEILAEQKNIHASVALQVAREFVVAAGVQSPVASDVTQVGAEFYKAMREWVK